MLFYYHYFSVIISFFDKAFRILLSQNVCLVGPYNAYPVGIAFTRTAIKRFWEKAIFQKYPQEQMEFMNE